MCGLPSDLNGVELHAHCKDGTVLGVFGLWICAHHGPEVVVFHLLLILHNEVAPLLLPCLALHLILVDRDRRIPVGKVLFEMFVDLVIELGKAELGAWDLLEDVPVSLHMLHD